MNSNIVELLTIEELADFLKISRGTIYNKVYKKEIPFCKVGGALRFDREDIEKWIKGVFFDPLKQRTVS